MSLWGPFPFKPLHTQFEMHLLTLFQIKRNKIDLVFSWKLKFSSDNIKLHFCIFYFYDVIICTNPILFFPVYTYRLIYSLVTYVMYIINVSTVLLDSELPKTALRLHVGRHGTAKPLIVISLNAHTQQQEP